MTGHPEFDAILDRADQFQHEVYTATGALPERFMVTEQEYGFLQVYYGGPSALGMNQYEIRLIGMRVCRPERMPWYRDNLYMEHFKISDMSYRAIYVYDPLPCLPSERDRCRTELPPTPQREVLCPCGEVIWNLSTYPWRGLMAGRSDEEFIPEMVDVWRQAFIRMFGVEPPSCGSGNSPDIHEHDPLPPLDDLNEGLTCCGKSYPTFAEFMTHRRRHGEG